MANLAVEQNILRSFYVGDDPYSLEATTYDVAPSANFGGAGTDVSYVYKPAQPENQLDRYLANKPIGQYARVSPQSAQWLKLQAESAARQEMLLMAKKEYWLDKQSKCLSKGHSAKKASAKVDKYTMLQGNVIAKQDRLAEYMESLPHDSDCPMYGQGESRQNVKGGDDAAGFLGEQAVFIATPEYEFVFEEGEDNETVGRVEPQVLHRVHPLPRSAYMVPNNCEQEATATAKYNADNTPNFQSYFFS